jgi:hypothetical protein
VDERQAFTPRRLFDGFLPSRSARDRRTERYFAGRLTEVGNGSAQAKRENRKTILPFPYRGIFEDECLQTIFEIRFFLCTRNSEEFSVILGNRREPLRAIQWSSLPPRADGIPGKRLV